MQFAVKQLPQKNKSDAPFPHQKILFTALLAISFIVRIEAVLHSKRYLMSDEAVVGMIALDILEGREVPYYLPGNNYGGGHILEALAAAPLFHMNGGPSDILLTSVTASVSCIFLAIYYYTLYVCFGKKTALISTALLSFSTSFFFYSFYSNGAMFALSFGWAGLYFFFHFLFSSKTEKLKLFLSALMMGLAFYCYEWALFFIISALFFWLLKAKKQMIIKQWPLLLLFLAGLAAGAFRFIQYSVKSDFRNLKMMESFLQKTTGTPETIWTKAKAFIAHDLPALFSHNLYEFPETIPSEAKAAFVIFLVCLTYTIIKIFKKSGQKPSDFIFSDPAKSNKQTRIRYLLMMSLLYAALYILSTGAGKAPRYLLPLSPLITPPIAAALLYSRKKTKIIFTALLIIFAAVQIFAAGKFMKEETIEEWNIKTKGPSIKKLATFLEKIDLTTVIAPYEIKWKLMFETNRKIVCASYLFGYDREHRYNAEVINRVNQKKQPLAAIFHKNYEFAKIMMRFNPQNAFDIKGFHDFLNRENIKYKKRLIDNQYLVYYDFSKLFKIPGAYYGSGPLFFSLF